MATPITIKRYNSSSWDTLHPITEGQNVYGSGTKATTALLDSNNKLARDFLQLYEHNITIMNSTYGMVTLRFINQSNGDINTYAKLAAALNGAGFNSYNNGKYIMASGYWTQSSSDTRIVCGVYASSTSQLNYRYITIASYNSSTTTTTILTTSPLFSYTTMASSSTTIYDYVRTL